MSACLNVTQTLNTLQAKTTPGTLHNPDVAPVHRSLDGPAVIADRTPLCMSKACLKASAVIESSRLVELFGALVGPLFGVRTTAKYPQDWWLTRVNHHTPTYSIHCTRRGSVVNKYWL